MTGRCHLPRLWQILLVVGLSPELRSQIEDRNILYSLNLRFRDMRFGLTEGFREIQPHVRLQETIDYGMNLPRAVHPAVWPPHRREGAARLAVDGRRRRGRRDARR